MKLAIRTYERICNRNFFKLPGNREQAFDLYRTELERCLESLKEEYSFFSELGLALDNDYQITSHDESIKREFEDFFINNINEFKLLLIKTERLFNKRNLINLFVKHLPSISRNPLELVDIYIILFDLLNQRKGLEEIVEEVPLTGRRTGSGIIKLAIRAFFRWKAGYNIPRHHLYEDKWQRFIEKLKGDEKRPYEGITRLEKEFYRFMDDPDYLLFLSILTNPVIWALKEFKGRGEAVYRDKISDSGQALRVKGMDIEAFEEREDKRTRLPILFKENKERLYEKLKQRATAISIGRKTPDEFFNYIKANVGLNP